MCDAGTKYLYSVLLAMDDHPEYLLVELELPFVEFVEEEYRICGGNGITTRVNVNGKWI